MPLLIDLGCGSFLCLLAWAIEPIVLCLPAALVVSFFKLRRMGASISKSLITGWDELRLLSFPYSIMCLTSTASRSIGVLIWILFELIMQGLRRINARKY